MVFSSLLFIFWFIPIFFGIYYILPSRFRNTALFIGSIIFYAWGEPTYLILIFISILVNYLAGRLMGDSDRIGAEVDEDRSSNSNKQGRNKRKLIMVLALVFDFAMLIVFKYSAFFVININSLLGTSIRVPDLTLPLGISFYTFQIASYIIDLYQGKIKAERNIITLGTYLVMFPQLIAGPIVVYKQVREELHERQMSLHKIEEGLGIFIIGLSSKVLIANQCGRLWDELAEIGYQNISMPLAWLGVLAYTLQIYFDFNGYSVMAIGLGKMLGFDIPRNFNYPYVSLSITEFWRRWHITLSSWFREYVYIPLGGNRKGKLRTYLNLFIVWFLTGFWHGAGWNFICWGLFFFIILIIEKQFISGYLNRHKHFARVYALLLIGLSWMIFAITDFQQLIVYFERLFSFSFGKDFVYYLRNYALILIIACILSTPYISERVKKINKPAIKTLGLVILFILSVSYLADASYNPFLYFRF